MKWWNEIGPRPYQELFLAILPVFVVMAIVGVLAVIRDWETAQLIYVGITSVSLNLSHTHVAIAVQREKLRGMIPGEWDEFLD